MRGMRRVRHSKRLGPLPLPDLTPILSPSLPTPSLPSILTNSSSSFSTTPSSNSSAPVPSTLPTTPPPPLTTSSPSSLPSSSPSSPTPSQAPAIPTPSPATSVYVVTSGGTVHTVTEFANTAPSATPSHPPVTQGFLQNKPLSGSIFGVLGLIVLLAIIAIATCSIRRRRSGRLSNEAISFDPATTLGSEGRYGHEKGNGSFGRRSPSFRDKDEHGYHPGPGASGYDQTPLQNGAVMVQLPNIPSRAFAPHANGTPSIRSGNSQRFARRY